MVLAPVHFVMQLYGNDLILPPLVTQVYRVDDVGTVSGTIIEPLVTVGKEKTAYTLKIRTRKTHC